MILLVCVYVLAIVFWIAAVVSAIWVLNLLWYMENSDKALMVPDDHLVDEKWRVR